MDTTFEVKGLSELRGALLALPLQAQRKATYPALRAGATPVVRTARSLVPRRTGLLRRRIQYRRSKFNKGEDGLTEVIVRVKGVSGKQVVAWKKSSGKSGRRNPNDPFYWIFHELGTRTGTPRVEFLQRALRQNSSTSAQLIRSALLMNLPKAVADARRLGALQSKRAAVRVVRRSVAGVI